MKKLVHVQSHTFLLETAVCNSAVIKTNYNCKNTYNVLLFVPFQIEIVITLSVFQRQEGTWSIKLIPLILPRLQKIQVLCAGDLDWKLKLLVTGIQISF